MDTRTDIISIMEAPTTYNNVHESIYQSYQLLEYVVWLLEQNTPAPVVLGIIHALRDTKAQYEARALGGFRSEDDTVK